MTDPDRIQSFLDFWFAPGMERRWFAHDVDLDRQLAQDFATELTDAAQGRLTHWLDSPNGALALVILLDQVPRNVFRGKYQAFALDSKALAVAEAAILSGFDAQVPADRRKFFYLPFEHSEVLSDQNRSVELFSALGDPDSLLWAERHRDIIARFGRFPHRNQALERETLPEEQAFLEQAEWSF